MLERAFEPVDVLLRHQVAVRFEEDKYKGNSRVVLAEVPNTFGRDFVKLEAVGAIGKGRLPSGNNGPLYVAYRPLKRRGREPEAHSMLRIYTSISADQERNLERKLCSLVLADSNEDINRVHVKFPVKISDGHKIFWRVADQLRDFYARKDVIQERLDERQKIYGFEIKLLQLRTIKVYVRDVGRHLLRRVDDQFANGISKNYLGPKPIF